MAEIQKLPKKTATNVTETTFLALFSPFFYPLPLHMAKFRHYSMRQSKVRAENTQQARDLVNHLGCHIWDMRKFVFYPKKYSHFHRFIYSTYFPLLIVYCFYSMYFIIGVIVKVLLQQHLQLSSTCRQVAMWTSRTEAVVFVVKRRSLWFSDDSE